MKGCDIDRIEIKNEDLYSVSLDNGMTFKDWFDRGIMRIHDFSRVLKELENQEKICPYQTPMALFLANDDCLKAHACSPRDNIKDKCFTYLPIAVYFRDIQTMDKVYKMGLRIFPLNECREFMEKICRNIFKLNTENLLEICNVEDEHFEDVDFDNNEFPFKGFEVDSLPEICNVEEVQRRKYCLISPFEDICCFFGHEWFRCMFEGSYPDKLILCFERKAII